MHNLTLSFSLALMCGITAYAQDVTETVVVETPGTLIDLVANLSSPRINTLVVKGQLDANDLSYLGAPSGKLRTVKELELRDITLVESDTPYKSFSYDHGGSVLGSASFTFYISSNPRWESKVVDTALGGQNYITKVYADDLSGLFAETTFRKVTLPEGLKSVGYAIFRNSPELEEVVIPSSITSISGSSFENAVKLTSVTLPEGLRVISADAFSQSGLTGITFPASLDSICDGAFSDTRISSFNPVNVSHIGEGCFKYCPIEGTLDLSNLTEISDLAFYMNTKVSDIRFSEKLDKIGADAFGGVGVSSLRFPGSLRYIGKEAFSGCGQLAEIEFPTEIEYLGHDAFKNTPWDRNLMGENGVKYIGNIAYGYCFDTHSDMETLSFREGTTIISENFKLDSKYVNGAYVYPDRILRHITFPSSLRRIESTGVFKDLENVEEIRINEGLEYIAEYAFKGSKKLWMESLPSTISYIGAYAFDECESLTELTLGPSVRYIGKGAFNRCVGLGTVRYNCMPDVETHGNILFGASGLYEVVIGKNVTNIPEYLFAFSGVRKISFESPEERVQPITLQPNCFYNCRNLKHVTLPAVDSLGKSVFHAAGLTELVINGDCNFIDVQGGSAIENLTVNGRIGIIGPEAFSGANIRSVTAHSCDSVGEDAFRNCKSLTAFPFATTATFGKYAFQSTPFTEITLGAGITEIPDGLFRECSNLEKIHFSTAPDHVGADAFFKTGLADFDFSNIKSIGRSAFANVPFHEMRDLYLPDGFSDLGHGAFSDVRFRTISLPVSLLSISEAAFARTDGAILSWRIPEDHRYEGQHYNIIDKGAFRNQIGNQSLVVPEGVHEIRNLAFYCHTMTSITLPSTLKVLFANALQWGRELSEIYCLAKTPPEIDGYGLLYDDYMTIFNGAIYVPAESVDRYREHSEWGKFDIRPIIVKVGSIELSDTAITLEQGATHPLTATILPENAHNKSLIWRSEDLSVAMVDPFGTVTAIAPGETRIIANAADGSGVYSLCTVRVEGGAGLDGIMADNLSVKVEGRDIIVNCSGDFAVYDTRGIMIHTGSSGRIGPLQPGIYIVKAGGKATGVAIR